VGSNPVPALIASLFLPVCPFPVPNAVKNDRILLLVYYVDQPVVTGSQAPFTCKSSAEWFPQSGIRLQAHYKWVEPSLYFYFEAAELPLKGSSGLDAIFRQSASALP